ncbi:hypothetical protein [Acuticoccus sediminis]|nr:hypothetical protein [Acuticoccus sediminis]
MFKRSHIARWVAFAPFTLANRARSPGTARAATPSAGPGFWGSTDPAGFTELYCGAFAPGDRHRDTARHDAPSWDIAGSAWSPVPLPLRSMRSEVMPQRLCWS